MVALSPSFDPDPFSSKYNPCHKDKTISSLQDCNANIYISGKPVSLWTSRERKSQKSHLFSGIHCLVISLIAIQVRNLIVFVAGLNQSSQPQDKSWFYENCFTFEKTQKQTACPPMDFAPIIWYYIWSLLVVVMFDYFSLI